MGRLVFPRPDRALLRHEASEAGRELGLLRLAGREEQRVAIDRLPVREHDALEPVASLEPGDPIFANGDAVALQTRESVRRNLRGAVAAQHEVAAPAREL